MRATNFSGSAATISVRVTPGATALTRIPAGPSSRARLFVRPLTANLLAGYPTPLGCPYRLTIELVLMMQACPALRISGSTALQPLKTAVTFKSMIFLKSSGL